MAVRAAAAAATLAGVSFNPYRIVVSKTKADSPRTTLSPPTCLINHPWRSLQTTHRFMSEIKTMASAPDSLSEKVTESVEAAKEACADDPVSGECAAAWDEVEEVSAAASDARLKKKESNSDPLETYCKDNPETEECRTYDN